MYRPLTGQPCTCKKGQERDNCAKCEGTGAQIDFEKVRQAYALVQIDVISVRMMPDCGTLRAFVDIRVGGSLVITQCAVMDGKRGLFATLPRQLARDGRWRDVIVVPDQALAKHYQDAILAGYEREVMKANAC